MVDSAWVDLVASFSAVSSVVWHEAGVQNVPANGNERTVRNANRNLARVAEQYIDFTVIILGGKEGCP